nr:zinc finger MYM-type protein 1-like [Lytechinus pictus]
MSQSGSKRRKLSKITSFFRRRDEEDPHEDVAENVSNGSTTASKEEASTSAPSSDQHDQQDQQSVNKSVIVNVLHLHHDKPNHPASTNIPPKERKNQKVYFLAKWFQTYPWLHYDEGKAGVLCFDCSKAERNGLLHLVKVKESAFIDTGFSNWKKATQRFESHQSSECHRCAMSQLQASNKPSIGAHLSVACQRQQEEARHSLLKIVSALRFLLRQGLAFRGHTEVDGNFHHLMELLRVDDDGLSSYLRRKTNFTSPKAQEEIIDMLAREVVTKVVHGIQEDGPFAVMVDGTQDITSTEQESICFRHVDDELHINEDFVGLYELPNTKGECIASVIFDVMTRLSLSPNNLRAQTYDGAANMQGPYNGCQAKVKESQPLALHFHCGAHISNLVLQHGVGACPIIRDAVQWVHELGVLFKRSGKYKALFKEIAFDESTHVSQASIRPLCPTRWLCRLPAIVSVMDNYDVVIVSLREMSKSGSGETSVKANGLLDRFDKGQTLLGLQMAIKPIAILEQLNSAMQARSANISGMLEAARVTTNEIRESRNENAFHTVYLTTEQKVEEYELEPLQLPRRRRVPQRLAGEGEQYTPDNPEVYFRQMYFSFLDKIIMQLEERFDPSKSGLEAYVQLEEALLGKREDLDILKRYPEMSANILAIQLPMFLQTTGASSLHEAVEAYRKMVPEVRALFPEVRTLMKLLLVCPVSSSECERSFSTLRRLKSWLRNTMTQRRLNAVAVCNVHCGILDQVNIEEVAKEFAARSDIRKNIYGNFLSYKVRGFCTS